MKKKILLLALAAVCLAAMLGGLIVANATEPEPATSIAGHNLSLDDNIRMIYYVDQTVPSGAETGVLCWLAPQETYTLGEEQFRLEQNGTQTVGGKVYAKYIFSNLAAKMMTVDVYAVSYVKDGDNITYSALDKYSVLQYCFNKKGSSATISGGTVTLGEMVTEILNYGTIAQRYFNYNTDRLANATYYQISVVNGTMEDGTTCGLYHEGETISLKATVPNGYQITWKNSADETVGTEAEITVTAAAKSETYTAVIERVYSQGLAFTSNGDGTCYVSGIGNCADTDIVIPPVSPDGDSVTSIRQGAFFYCSSLTSVTIPDSVTSIGQSAFGFCTSLISVTIPDSVTSIGQSAFGDCTSLISITIPDGVTSIGNYAFDGCTSLTSITIPDSVTSIGHDAFTSCKSLTSVTILDAVTSIGRSAFSNCTSLTSITISDSVTSIEQSAFYGCTALTSITIPESVMNIGERAFSSCTSLESITVAAGNPVYHSSGNCLIETATGMLIAGYKNSIIPNDGSVTSIGNYAFDNCTALTSVTIPDSVTSIGNYAFSYCTALTSVTIPDSVTSIGNYAFSYCTSLTSVTIPDSVTSIGERAFSYCTSLTSITIPNSVTSIGEYVFYNCTALTSVTIPDSVTSIGNSAFSYCTSLTSVTIPDSVTSIGERAFSYCTSLTSITIPNGVTSIGDDAFLGCSSLQYNVYSYAKYLGNANNPYVALIKASNTYNTTFCNIHPDTKVIADRAFYNCSNLTSITIPDNVTSIGSSAFEKCTSLTSVTFANTNGWYRTKTKGASSGTNMTVTNPSTNATNLVSYYSNYWYRK